MEPVKGGSLAKLPEELEQIYRREQPGLSTASWAVRFAASLENVLVVLSGMSNMEQVVAAIRSKITVDCTACDGCGKCEAVCPQKLPIRELLKEVKGAFEL